MKFVFAALALGVSSAGPALAALPPFYDSGRQIEVLLDSGEIADKLRIAPVEAIEALGDNAAGNPEWRVKSRDCSLTAEIRAIPLPQGLAGAASYELVRVGDCE